MNRGIDVRHEVRKLATSKPVYAVAGVGVLASQTLRELPARLAKLRHEATVTSVELPAKATEYVLTARTKAAAEYDRLASRGRKVMNGHSGSAGKAALRGRASCRGTKAK